MKRRVIRVDRHNLTFPGYVTLPVPMRTTLLLEREPECPDLHSALLGGDFPEFFA